MNEDLEHLRLLEIGHYVVAGLAGLFSLFPVIHLVLGIAAVTGHLDNGHGGNQFPAIVGWFFIAFAIIWILCGLTFTICLLLAGRFLAQRRRYMYCLVMACVACMFSPFGTILGVFSILVLVRPSVKQLFGRGPL
jgi:hypothetical protein